MISRILLITIIVASAHSEDYHKLKLGGDCEALRKELDGADDSATKLSKLNAFLDSLGDGIRQKFWEIVAAAKTDAQTNLPSDSAKEVAGEVISDFEQGNLFKSSQKTVAQELRSKFESLTDVDKAAVRKMGRLYGKQIKALVFPLLPQDCRATTSAADDAGKEAVASGFDSTGFLPRTKRELMFIDNVVAAFREFRSRRGF